MAIQLSTVNKPNLLDSAHDSIISHTNMSDLSFTAIINLVSGTDVSDNRVKYNKHLFQIMCRIVFRCATNNNRLHAV